VPLARINNRLLHLVHIPKTGGASITDYMRKKGEVALYSREKLEWAQSTPQHLEFETSRALIPEGFADASFAIMRNPISRLLSEYRYRATRYNSGVLPFSAPSSSDKMKVELDWGEDFYGTFDEWVDLVFERCIRFPCTCDNHIRPQSDFIGGNMKIFIFERGLEKVYRWIDRITDTQEIISSLDRNESKKFVVEVSSKTQIKIENFYQKDYCMLNSLKIMHNDYHTTKNNSVDEKYNIICEKFA